MEKLTEHEEKAMQQARADLLSEVDIDTQTATLISAAYRQAWKDCLNYQRTDSPNPDLLAALQPFAALWLDAFSRMSDDAPIAAIGDNTITVGDVKAARAAIAKAEGREG